MIKKTKVGANIVYSTIYELLVILVPLIVSPYVSRRLGVEGIGVFSFSLAVANYFKRASMLGVLKYGNRSIALVNNDSKSRRSTFWAIYSVQFYASMICILIYSGYILLFASNNVPAVLQYLYISASLFSVEWYYYGREEFKIVVLVTAFCKLGYLIGCLMFIKNQEDTNLYIALFALSYLIPSIILFGRVLYREKYIKPNVNNIKDVSRGMMILFIPVIAVTIYKSMDKLMLGIFCDTAYENGIYENAEKVLHVPIALITAVSCVLMPRMTVLFRDSNDKKAGNLIYTTVQYSAFMSIGCAFALATLSKMFSVIYWGADFYKCGELLTTFAFSIPFMSFAEILRTQYIIPKKKDKIYIIAVIGAAVINLIINSILIPKIGAEGAVIGTVASEAGVCVYQAFKVRKELPISKYTIQYLMYAIPGISMFLLLTILARSVSYSTVHLLVLIIIGFMIYITTAVVFMSIFAREQLTTALDNAKKLLYRKN